MASTPQIIERPAGGGRVVGSYHLERRLGAGGSGEVWLGRHVQTRGTAAVKILHERSRRRSSVRDFFAREGRAIARLQHPHIVALFEIGAEYLVTAFVDGANLQRRLATPMDPARAVRIALQVASALEHAHGRGVIHRDVKPGNILVDEQDNAFLADFGIAEILDEDDADRKPSRAGTPAFMAPEQRRGGAVGPAADQYSLGRTLVEMLAGIELPVDPAAALALLPAGLPGSLKSALARATDPLAEDRFPSVRALAAALESVDVSAYGPPFRLAPELRARQSFHWCARPRSQARIGPDLVRTDLTLSTLDERRALPPEATATFRRETGLADFGWSMFGRSDRLGPLDDPTALARISEVVVLLHGWMCTREVWQDVAAAVCRDNPQTLVLTPDVHGCGETPFADPWPAPTHATPRGLTLAVLRWLTLLGLSDLPTVLVGHSMADHALMTLRDDELGSRTLRVAVTPFVPLPASRRDLKLASLVTRIASLHPWSYRQLLDRMVRQRRNHTAELSDEQRRKMHLTAQALSSGVLVRVLDGLADSEVAMGRLGRCVVLFGTADPSLRESSIPWVVERYGLPEPNVMRLASGGHFPHLQSVLSPESTARNRDEMVHTIGDLLAEARQGTILSTDASETRTR